MNTKRIAFNYGQPVRILPTAPNKYHPSEIGFVCGMINIETEEDAIAYDCIDSSWLYTIEFRNGSSLLIPDKYLEKAT